MEFFLNNKVQKKSRVLSDICLPSSLCTHLHDSVCKKQKYLSSSFTKSRRNSIVSARSQQVFSIHSLFCSTEKRENLYTISQGCWTMVRWAKSKFPVKTYAVFLIQSQHFQNRSVHLQPEQPLHYCAGREFGPGEDKGRVQAKLCE